MKIINGTQSFVLPPCRLVIGKFDGIHQGHKVLLDYFRSTKSELPIAMLTFDFSQSMNSRETVLFTNQERCLLAKSLRIDYLVRLPFDDSIRTMCPEQFVEEILHRRIGAKEICVGEDFRYGFERKGDISTLMRDCAKNGILCHSVPVKRIREEKISSSELRSLLADGRINEMPALLGYPYFIQGTVIHGKELGRTIGFPTINLSVSPEKALPPIGVYATVCLVNGQYYKGITNVGDNPTVRDGVKHPLTIETHLLGANDDLYERECTLFFCSKMREQRTFSDLEELSTQLKKDKEMRLTIFDAPEDFTDVFRSIHK